MSREDDPPGESLDARTSGSADNMFRASVLAHRTGRIAEAIIGYEHLLRDAPERADVLNLLGLAQYQIGANDAAVAVLSRGRNSAPLDANIRNHLGLALSGLGRHSEACRAFLSAVLLEPNLPSPIANLGAVLQQIAPEQSIPALRYSLCFSGIAATIYSALASAYRATGDLDRAEAVIAEGLSKNPEAAALWLTLANIQTDRKTLVDAETALRRALELAPGLAEATSNLANNLRTRRLRVEAEAVVRRGLAHSPLDPLLLSTLGAVLYEVNDLSGSLLASRQAAVIAPSMTEPPANVAQVSHYYGDCEAAAKTTSWSLAMDPENRELHINQSTHLIGAGRLVEGWREWRWRLEANDTGLPATLWDGRSGQGRRLLIQAEQGLGDEVLFASCFAELGEVLRRGDFEQVVVECDRRLRPIFERSFPMFTFVDRLRDRSKGAGAVDYSEIVRAHRLDCWVPAGTLPAFYQTSVSGIETAPYLYPDLDRVAVFRDWLEGLGPGRKIGLCWRSLRDRDRSDIMYPTLPDCRDLLELPNTEFISLQYDHADAEIDALHKEHRLTVHKPDLDITEDLDGVLALTAALDGVVSGDTIAFMLANTCGKPAIVMSYGYLWTSLSVDGKSPWFPTAQIVERNPAEPWAQAMKRIADATTHKFGSP